MRAPDGTFTRFDAPGAGTGALQGTIAGNINPAGAIAGNYWDSSNLSHGFLRRAPHGTFTTFDAPGAGTDPGQGTFTGWLACINPAMAIAGYYLDAGNVNHGFLRARDGTITTFDAPGAGTGAGQGTYPQNVNLAGVITGNYWDSSGMAHGFLRAPDGTFTTFDVPGAGAGSGQGTFPYSNNSPGGITGWYVDASGARHGFLRSP